jgi:hypothetical protein
MPEQASATDRPGSPTTPEVNQKRPDGSRQAVWAEDPPTSTSNQGAIEEMVDYDRLPAA